MKFRNSEWQSFWRRKLGTGNRMQRNMQPSSESLEVSEGTVVLRYCLGTLGKLAYLRSAQESLRTHKSNTFCYRNITKFHK